MEADNGQITGLVLTFNGERLLDKCLQSLQFCARILVVDSFSTDASVEICREFGADVIRNPWSGPGPQFEFAFKQVHTPWIFSLDQDEICTGVLREQILQITAQPQSRKLAGCFVRRKSWYYDRFMLHSGWYPDYLLRLFQPDKMRVRVSGAHYSFIPEADTARLSGEILHYPYFDFADQLEKINSYASQGAASLAVKGKKGGVWQGISHGLARFIKLYLLKAGFLDGKAGFVNAAHGAFYAFSKYLRVKKEPWGRPFKHK